MTILSEGEDFEVWDAGRLIGRYMVNSQEPYEINLEEEIGSCVGDIHTAIERLLNSRTIVEYKPNYTVKVSLFGDVNVHKTDDCFNGQISDKEAEEMFRNASTALGEEWQSEIDIYGQDGVG